MDVIFGSSLALFANKCLELTHIWSITSDYHLRKYLYLLSKSPLQRTLFNIPPC